MIYNFRFKNKLMAAIAASQTRASFLLHLENAHLQLCDIVLIAQAENCVAKSFKRHRRVLKCS